MTKPTQQPVTRANKKEYYERLVSVLDAYDHCAKVQHDLWWCQWEQGHSDTELEELREREGLCRLAYYKRFDIFVDFANRECRLAVEPVEFYHKLDDAGFRDHIRRHVAYIRRHKRVELPLHSPDYIWQIYQEKNPPVALVPDQQLSLF